jgi:hypothetical protein
MKSSFEALKKFIASYKPPTNKEGKNALEFLVARTVIAMETRSAAIQNTNVKPSVKNQAAKNQLVNMVSALEVYLKDVVMEKEDKWREEGLNNLLKEKITLHEAYDHFRNIALSKAAIISKFLSFNSIDSIDHVFSQLFTDKFLDQLEKFEHERYAKKKKENPDSIHMLFSIVNDSDWRKHLVNLFAIRNRVVHEFDLDEILNETEIENIYPSYIAFVNSFTSFISDSKQGK